MVRTRFFATYFLMSLCLGACSKQSPVDIPSSSDQSSKELDHLRHRPLLFTAEGIPAFKPSDEINSTQIEDFRRYINASEQQMMLEKLRQQLKLTPDQILVIGLKRPDQEDAQEIDLSDPTLLYRANDLTIDHIRFLRTAQEVPREEFEKKEAYQLRLNKIKEAQQQMTARMQVDLGRLEDALNLISQPIRINLGEPDQLNQYSYDVDQERLTILAPLAPNTDWGLQIQDEPIKVLHLVAHVTPELAQSIKDRFSPQFEYVLGFILDRQNEQYSVSGVVVFAQNTDQGKQLIALGRFTPLVLEVVTMTADQRRIASQSLLNTAFALPFGLKNYHRISSSNTAHERAAQANTFSSAVDEKVVEDEES